MSDGKFWAPRATQNQPLKATQSPTCPLLKQCLCLAPGIGARTTRTQHAPAALSEALRGPCQAQGRPHSRAACWAPGAGPHLDPPWGLRRAPAAPPKAGDRGVDPQALAAAQASLASHTGATAWPAKACCAPDRLASCDNERACQEGQRSAVQGALQHLAWSNPH